MAVKIGFSLHGRGTLADHEIPEMLEVLERTMADVMPKVRA